MENIKTNKEKTSERVFEEWFGNFKETVRAYNYYTNFENVYANASEFKEEINILNSLVGSKKIEEDFLNLIKKYPEVKKAIPILIATREKMLRCADEKGEVFYNFQNQNIPDEQYAYFMQKTGLFDLLANHVMSNLYDFILGVNVGLDSHGRKNRSGDAMEVLVDGFVNEAGYVENYNYFKQMTSREVETRFGIDLSCLSDKAKKAAKKFDFVIDGGDTIYAIEANFFATHGSKIDTVAGGYELIEKETSHLKNFQFIWITDGMGWKDSYSNLKKAFENIEHMYNINDLENGIIASGFKQQ